MATTPQPESIFKEIELGLAKLNVLECKPSELPEFDVRRLHRSMDSIEAIDRVGADAARAHLFTLQFRLDEAQACIKNIEQNGNPASLLRTRSQFSSNSLHATNAFADLREISRLRTEPNLNNALNAAFAVGGFRVLCEIVNAANAEQRVIAAPKNIIPLSRLAAPVLDYYEISDADIASCVDEAGEVLRSRSVLWLHENPQITVAGLNSGDPGVAVEYRVPLTAEEAVEMNTELAGRLIDRDVFKPGFNVGFIGVRP